MSHVVVSNLAYAHPGGDLLFSDVSFKVGTGEHVGLVGANGVGKSTLLKILAGRLEAIEGDADVGPFAYMPQDVGVGADVRTVREMLLELAPPRLRAAGEKMLAAERELAAGGDAAGAGMRLGEAIGDWSECGGYELEGQWDAACRRIVRAGLRRRRRAAARPRSRAASASGSCSRCSSPATRRCCCSTSPTTSSTCRRSSSSRRGSRRSKKTVLLVCHDRDLLGAAATGILTLEGNGCWMHGGSYRTYPEARARRQELLGDRLEQWKREERRLFQFYKIMKQRAAVNDGNAKRADAAETRWRRFVDAGPPPPPAPEQQIVVRMPGAESARIVVEPQRGRHRRARAARSTRRSTSASASG